MAVVRLRKCRTHSLEMRVAKRKVLESRRNERVEAGWRVVITLSGGDTVEGRISDVSAGGLQFAAPIQYRRGDRVGIDIITNPKNFVRTRILIVRAGTRRKQTWIYGAKFIDMTRLDRVLLQNGIEQLDPDVDGSHDAVSKKAPGFRDLIDWFLRG